MILTQTRAMLLLSIIRKLEHRPPAGSDPALLSWSYGLANCRETESACEQHRRPDLQRPSETAQPALLQFRLALPASRIARPIPTIGKDHSSRMTRCVQCPICFATASARVCSQSRLSVHGGSFRQRPDSMPNASGPRTATLRIYASTTSRSVAGLSMTFADNVGTNNTLVFDGTLTWTTQNLPGAGTPGS